MDKNNLIIIASVASAPFLGNLVIKLFDRKKQGAEVHSINITGEISIGEQWQKYALQQQKDKEELQREFTRQIDAIKEQHTKEINILQQKFTLKIVDKDEEISNLNKRIDDLQEELLTYKKK